MRTRSVFEICLPPGLFLFACLLSVPTMVLAVAWMSAGVILLGYRKLEDFPSSRMPHAWRHGLRGACLHFYHLAWWPWYLRRELRDAVRHLRCGRFAQRRTDDSQTPPGRHDSSKEN